MQNFYSQFKSSTAYLISIQNYVKLFIDVNFTDETNAHVV